MVNGIKPELKGRISLDVILQVLFDPIILNSRNDVQFVPVVDGNFVVVIAENQ